MTRAYAFGKRIVALACFVAERFDNLEVEIWIARDEFPKALTAQFPVAIFLGAIIVAVATAIDGDDVS